MDEEVPTPDSSDQPKPLSDNLQDYYSAISSEFSLSNDNEPVSIARDKLVSLLPTATQTLQSLLISGETDAIRLNAVKLVFEHTMGKPGSGAAEDELSKIVQQLTAKKPAKEKSE